MISIIIPTLNEEKLLPTLLEELVLFRKSSNKNFEIIISDGNSIDGTLNIANAHADVVIMHKGNYRQTIAEGKNHGAQRASGEILMFLCADCRIKNINTFFDFLENDFLNSDYSASTFRFDIFPDEKKISDLLFHSFYNNYVRVINYLGLGMGRGECQVIKKDAFVYNKGFNENLHAGEDFDLFKRVKKSGKIKVAFDHVIYESPRRYRRFGYKKVVYLWLINALSVLKISKKMSTIWEEVR